MDLFDIENKAVQREYGKSNAFNSPSPENFQASQNDVDDFFENFQEQVKIRFVKFKDGANNNSGSQTKQCLNRKFEIEETPKEQQVSKNCIMRGFSLQNGNQLSQDQLEFQNENNNNYLQLSSSHHSGKAVRLNSIEQVQFLPNIVRNCFREKFIIEDQNHNSFKSIQTQGGSSPREENKKKMLKQLDECNSGDNNIFNIRDRKLQRQRILSLQVRPSAQHAIYPQNDAVFSHQNDQLIMEQYCIPYRKSNAQLQQFKSQDFNQETSLRSFNAAWKGNSTQQSVLEQSIAQQKEGLTSRFFSKQQQNANTQNQFELLRENNKQNQQTLKPIWTSNCSLPQNQLVFPSLKTASTFDESSSFDWSESLASHIKAQSNWILSKNQLGIQSISEQSLGSLHSDRPIKKKTIKISKESAFAKIIEQDFKENTHITYQKIPLLLPSSSLTQKPNISQEDTAFHSILQDSVQFGGAEQHFKIFKKTKKYDAKHAQPYIKEQMQKANRLNEVFLEHSKFRDEDKENIEQNSLNVGSNQIQQQKTFEKEVANSMNMNKGSKERRIQQKKKRY